MDWRRPSSRSRASSVASVRGSRARWSPRGTRGAHGLVTTQVALALMLLIGLGLLTNSYLRLTYRHLNFDASGLLTFEVRTAAPQRCSAVSTGTSKSSPSPRKRWPGSRAPVGAAAGRGVGGISFPPVDSLILPIMNVSRRTEDRPGEEAAVGGAVLSRHAKVLRRLRTPFVRGREITEKDTPSSRALGRRRERSGGEAVLARKRI